VYSSTLAASSPKPLHPCSLPNHNVQETQCQRAVSTRFDRQPLVGQTCRFGPAGIDYDELAAGCCIIFQCFPEQGPVRFRRIDAPQDDATGGGGIQLIFYWPTIDEAVYPDPRIPAHSADPHVVGGSPEVEKTVHRPVDGVRCADAGGKRFGAVSRFQLLQTWSDIGHCFFPGDSLPLSGTAFSYAFHGVIQSLGVVEDLFVRRKPAALAKD
jgi:hypothetical protein